MNMKRSKPVFLSVIAFGLLSLLFQNCSGNLTLNIEKQEVLKFAGGGSGDGYEGKLVLIHRDPGFTCEGWPAPNSVLRRDDSGTWYLATNLPEKCAVDQVLVSDVTYDSLQLSILYRNVQYIKILPSPTSNISLANYDFRVPISAENQKSLVCPNNFIRVTARAPYTSSSFCVAKFEMKIEGMTDGTHAGLPGASTDPTFKAEARSDGTPFTNLTRDQSITKCNELGAGYDLITNNQWQTLAQTIELQATNWTSGSIGAGMLFVGHSESSTALNLSVSNPADEFDQTGNTPAQSAGSGLEQRRTQHLPNGEVIWDLSGNVLEWVKENNTTNFVSNSYFSQLTDATHPEVSVVGDLSGTASLLFGPTVSYPTLGSPLYGGLGYGMFSLTGTGIMRGGYLASQTQAGVFSTGFFNPNSYFTNGGFRCVYQP
jgi:hypothetical protein